MVTQLSTSHRLSQLDNAAGFRLTFKALCLVCATLAGGLGSVGSLAQNTDFDVKVEPLTAIDRQYMSQQRNATEQLANRLGRRLTGDAERDIDTLQRLLDEGWVRQSDTETLQGMGMVMGDLLAKRLDMDWVVYRDTKGRSRALRYRDTDTFLFPITMISRRHESGSDRRLRSLYDETVSETIPRLPGGKWLIP